MSTHQGRDDTRTHGAGFNQALMGRPRLLLALIFPLLLAAVVLFWLSLVESDHELAESRFKRQAQYAEQAIRHRLSSYEGLTSAARGLISGRDRVDEEEWRIFIDSLEVARLYPALEALALVEAESAADDQETMRVRLHAPESQRHAHSVGMDLAAVPHLREAAIQARDSGQAMAELYREEGSTDTDLRGDIFHLLPLYHPGMPRLNVEQRRAAFRGWLLGIYHVDDLFAHPLGPSGEQSLHIEVFGNQLGGHARLSLFDSRSHDPNEEGQRLHDATVRFGTRDWLLRFTSTQEFDSEHVHSHLPLLLIGLALVVVLGYAARLLLSGRRRAEAMAEEMTQALRESEERYRELFQGNRAVQLLIAPGDGRIVDANDAAIHFYGWPREQLLSMRINQINTLSKDAVKAEMAAALLEQRNHFHFRHRLADGGEREVEVHSGPVRVAGRELLYSIIHDITDRRRAEEALRRSEAKYRRIIDTTAEGYWLFDAESRELLEVNDAICGMLGYSRYELLGRPITEFTDDEGVALFDRQRERLESHEQRHYEVTLRQRDGQPVHTRINATNLRNAQGQATQVFAFITDISRERHAEEKLRQAATFFDTTSEAITITDADNRIIAVNPAFSWITGYSEEEILGKDPQILSSGRQDKGFYREMWHTLQRLGRWQGEIWNRRKSGEIYPEWLSIVAIKDDHGKVIQHMAVFSDITKRKQDEHKIWQQANFDALTGLPNRTLFMDRLGQAIHRAHREGDMAALLFIDLDRFKWVNDTLGHGAGDELLQEVARRLGRCVRETDTVARLGGDEFTAIISGISSQHDVDLLAEKMLRLLAEMFEIQGHEVHIGGSIGITIYPRDGEEVETLLRNADTAMYRAKQAGRNTYRYFTQAMNEEAERRMRLEHDIRLALGREELAIHYQPIVDAGGTLLGAEALLRWRHAELGPIPPDEFIPLAEESGAIVEIEQWVIGRACEQVVEWSSRMGRTLFVSVNISGMHCKNLQCIEVVDDTLIRCGLQPGQLKLEITERMMMEHTEQVVGMFERLRARGVSLAVDDFGTGYSSLSYLKRFPVDVLKIDRAFVSDLPGDEEDVALVEAIIAMAHSLGLKVVAEGVETEEQRVFLAGLGSEMMQGYHFSRPLDEQAFMALLDQYGAKP